MLRPFLCLCFTLLLSAGAVAQHDLTPEQRADLLRRGLEQLPENREHIRPALIAGWGTVEQIKEVIAEVGWDYKLPFAPDVATRISLDQPWNPVGIPRLVLDPGTYVVWVDGRRLPTSWFELWEFAICQQPAEVVIELLDGTPWKQWFQRRGFSPLATVAMEGDPALFAWFLEQDCDPNSMLIGSEDYRVLHAVQHRADGSTHDLTRALIQKGAEVNARNVHGANAIWYAAAMSRDLETVRFLLQSGSDVTFRGTRWNESILHFCAYRGTSPEILRTLIAAGADPLWKVDFGETAYEVAQSSGALSEEALQLLRVEP